MRKINAPANLYVPINSPEKRRGSRFASPSRTAAYNAGFDACLSVQQNRGRTILCSRCWKRETSARMNTNAGRKRPANLTPKAIQNTSLSPEIKPLVKLRNDHDNQVFIVCNSSTSGAITCAAEGLCSLLCAVVPAGRIMSTTPAQFDMGRNESPRDLLLIFISRAESIILSRKASPPCI